MANCRDALAAAHAADSAPAAASTVVVSVFRCEADIIERELDRESRVGDMAENEKCAHGVCDCTASKDSKYCSEYCKNAEDSKVTEIACGCEHTGCR